MKKRGDPYLLPASCVDIKVESQSAGVIPQSNGFVRGTVSVGKKVVFIMVM